MAKILLDPGHGRQRRGFVNISGWSYCSEGENNFIYARDYLKPALERVGFTVGMTKSSIGQDPSLRTRGRMGRGYDLLLSIHTNAANGKATGTEIWDSTNPKESDKKMFGELSGAIAKAIGTNNRGVKYRRSSNGSNYYGILRHGYAKKNAIIEHVFHDNYTDTKKFITNMKAAAEATANTLAKYYNVKKQNNPQEENKPIDTDKEYFEANGLKVIKTTANKIYISQLGGKTLREVGAYGINGTFFDTRNPEDDRATWGIAVNGGKPIGPNAHLNHPKRHIKRATLVYDGEKIVNVHLNNIADYQGKVVWAIGGVGLSPYWDPKWEQVPMDILRNTAHTGIAFKGLDVYLIVTDSPCTLYDFKKRVEKLNVDGAIALDGGGSTQMLWKGKKGVHTSRKLNNIVGVK